MTNTYKISGITCNGCKITIKEALQSVKGVKGVIVNLDKERITVKMNKHVPIETLQKALSKRYTLTKEDKPILQDKILSKEKSKLQQLFPLFLIFSYIIIASILLNRNSWNTTSFMLDFMGLFYIVFSFFKLLDIKGFSQSFKMYDPLAKAIPVYGWVYPFIELLLGLMFLIRIKITVALVVTILILGVTIIGVTQILLNKKTVQCACLGTVLKLPMTLATFIENSIMLTTAAIMLLNVL